MGKRKLEMVTSQRKIQKQKHHIYIWAKVKILYFCSTSIFLFKHWWYHYGLTFIALHIYQCQHAFFFEDCHLSPSSSSMKEDSSLRPYCHHHQRVTFYQTWQTSFSSESMSSKFYGHSTFLYHDNKCMKTWRSSTLILRYKHIAKSIICK